jgi:hypothetical protein
MALSTETVWRVDVEQYPWNVAATEIAAAAMAASAATNNPGVPFDIYPVTRYVYIQE